MCSSFGPFSSLQRLQRLQQHRHVVAVDRSEIMETQFLEQRARHEHALGVFFPALEEAVQESAALHAPLGAFAHRVERAAGHQARQHFRQRADVLADRHLVVVEDDQHVRIEVAAVMQRFVRHAAGEAAVADDGDDLALVAFALRGERHAERGGDRGRGMTHAESVVRAFFAFRERREAILFLDRGDLVAAAGQDLVRIALMADVPDQAIVRRVIQIMQRDGQFDHAEPGAEMSADAGHRFDQVFAQLARDIGQFAFVELAQVGRRVDGGEARIALGVNH